MPAEALSLNLVSYIFTFNHVPTEYASNLDSELISVLYSPGNVPSFINSDTRSYACGSVAHLYFYSQKVKHTALKTSSPENWGHCFAHQAVVNI